MHVGNELCWPFDYQITYNLRLIQGKQSTTSPLEHSLDALKVPKSKLNIKARLIGYLIKPFTAKNAQVQTRIDKKFVIFLYFVYVLVVFTLNFLLLFQRLWLNDAERIV